MKLNFLGSFGTKIGLRMNSEKQKAWREEKLRSIRQEPEKHKHDFDALSSCCWDPHLGALDLGLMEEHSKGAPLGRNGGVACDVSRGPCACGAWH